MKELHEFILTKILFFQQCTVLPLAPAAYMLSMSYFSYSCKIWQHVIFSESICATSKVIFSLSRLTDGTTHSTSYFFFLLSSLTYPWNLFWVQLPLLSSLIEIIRRKTLFRVSGISFLPLWKYSEINSILVLSKTSFQWIKVLWNNLNSCYSRNTSRFASWSCERSFPKTRSGRSSNKILDS